jgi:FkbH-like protein
MDIPTLAEIETTLAAAAPLPPVSIAVLRNVTVEPMVPYLRWGACQAGFAATVAVGGYDVIGQECLGRSEGLARADLVLVIHSLRTASPDLFDCFASLSQQQVRDRVDAWKRDVDAWAKGLRRQCAATIVWSSVERPLHPAFGPADPTLELGQGAAIAEMNQFLAGVLRDIGNAVLLDLDQMVRQVGGANFFDRRAWNLARAPFSRTAMGLIGDWVGRVLRAARGQVRKCLVLDCDNVLWGGIVGEDGPANIRLGLDYPGNAFRALQCEALNLFGRGIILALCSRNNPADVWEVFDRHPDMVLRRHHIAAHRIDWRPKPGNLVELAAELNIGLDSMVFADDSLFEIEQVRAIVPEVATLHLPAPQSAPELLAGCGLFDQLAVTAEDRSRGQLYHAAALRRELHGSVNDLEAYLRELKVAVTIAVAGDDDLTRVAQLTQRTNQFNLTTRRRTESELGALGPDHTVLVCRARDRFGDYGMVGAAVLRHGPGLAEIDTFLLSCRALGRGIEDAMLEGCVRHAVAQGARLLRAGFIPTRKNAPAAEFLPRMGFQPTHDPLRQTFEIELPATACRSPQHVFVDYGEI